MHRLELNTHVANDLCMAILLCDLCDGTLRLACSLVVM